MMLVGNVANRVCVLIDDLVDTANTLTRAAKLLKKEGATAIYALVTHGVLSGDAVNRVNASAIDKLVVTNSVPQSEHRALCPKLEVLDGKTGPAFPLFFPRVYLTLSSFSYLRRGHPPRSPRRIHLCSLSIRLKHASEYRFIHLHPSFA